jgi:hypothetical protein
VILLFLERARRVGSETLQRVSEGLFRSAIGGVMQRVPGEPFPRDVQMKNDAEAILATLSRVVSRIHALRMA